MAQNLLRSSVALKESSLFDKTRYAFLRDVQDLFRKERHGHLGPWHYSDNEGQSDPVKGALLWESFVDHSRKYYLLSQEVSLLNSRLKELIAPKGKDIFLIDFGPGSTKAVNLKTKPVINALGNVSAYCPIDCSQTFVEEACDVIGQSYPDISLHPLQADYYLEDVTLSKNYISRFGIFLGGSISNIEGHPDNGIPNAKIVDYLAKFKTILGNNAEMLITYDSKQDEQSIIESYMHPAQTEFGRNIMRRIVRDLPIAGNFDPNAWIYEPLWHKKSHQLCHTVIAQADMSFLLGRENFKVKDGERFILDNSFKYPVEIMKDLMSEAGWTNVDCLQNDGESMVAHLVKS